MELLTPSGTLLTSTFSGSHDAVFMTPFFSKSGLELLDTFFDNAEKCEFWTKLNVFDWQAGYADLPELSTRLKKIADRGGHVEIFIKSNLHAKLYFSRDLSKAILGSSNLTSSGFRDNLEMAISISGDECSLLDTWLESARRLMSRLELRSLIDAIEITQDAIPPASRKQMFPEVEEDENFQAAVEIFEGELLGNIVVPVVESTCETIVSEPIPGEVIVRPTEQGNIPDLPEVWPSYTRFIDYCREENSEGANVVANRAAGENNLSGHVKHFFYGALIFYFEHPDMIRLVPDDLGEQKSVIYAEEPWMETWLAFLANHDDETYTDPGFSFRTLKVYLPPRLGGTTTTGGAGTGTFKRVLPLLKKMLLDSGVIGN